MYERPLEVIYGKTIADNVRKQLEDYVMNVIADVGIKVDKDELIKALKYDRNQYEKGFQDGVNSKKFGYWHITKDGFIICSECKEENTETSNFCPHCGVRMIGE